MLNKYKDKYISFVKSKNSNKTTIIMNNDTTKNQINIYI